MKGWRTPPLLFCLFMTGCLGTTLSSTDLAAADSVRIAKYHEDVKDCVFLGTVWAQEQAPTNYGRPGTVVGALGAMIQPIPAITLLRLTAKRRFGADTVDVTNKEVSLATGLTFLNGNAYRCSEQTRPSVTVAPGNLATPVTPDDQFEKNALLKLSFVGGDAWTWWWADMNGRLVRAVHSEKTNLWTPLKDCVLSENLRGTCESVVDGKVFSLTIDARRLGNALIAVSSDQQSWMTFEANITGSDVTAIVRPDRGIVPVLGCRLTADMTGECLINEDGIVMKLYLDARGSRTLSAPASP